LWKVQFHFENDEQIVKVLIYDLECVSDFFF